MNCSLSPNQLPTNTTQDAVKLHMLLIEFKDIRSELLFFIENERRFELPEGPEGDYLKLNGNLKKEH